MDYYSLTTYFNQKAQNKKPKAPRIQMNRIKTQIIETIEKILLASKYSGVNGNNIATMTLKMAVIIMKTIPIYAYCFFSKLLFTSSSTIKLLLNYYKKIFFQDLNREKKY